MLQPGMSGIEKTQQSLQMCIKLLLKDLYFSRSPSPMLAFTSPLLSPLSPDVEKPEAVGQGFLSRVYHSIKSSWCWHFSLFQAESETAAAWLWIALQQKQSLNWDPDKVGLDV